jgi:hypothetical protein
LFATDSQINLNEFETILICDNFLGDVSRNNL